MKLNRRGFLKTLGISTAVVVSPKTLAEILSSIPTNTKKINTKYSKIDMTRDTIDVNSLDSTDGYREFISTRCDSIIQLTLSVDKYVYANKYLMKELYNDKESIFKLKSNDNDIEFKGHIVRVINNSSSTNLEIEIKVIGEVRVLK